MSKKAAKNAALAQLRAKGAISTRDNNSYRTRPATKTKKTSKVLSPMIGDTVMAHDKNNYGTVTQFIRGEYEVKFVQPDTQCVAHVCFPADMLTVVRPGG